MRHVIALLLQNLEVYLVVLSPYLGGEKNNFIKSLFSIYGVWPSGKASVFGTENQRFESFHSNFSLN